uniref:10 kDa chaperonin n=1 Tax=Rhizophora mucronata TaxID=61149 RepID=A0A2P2IRY1_RHIMU
MLLHLLLSQDPLFVPEPISKLLSLNRHFWQED